MALHPGPGAPHVLSQRAGKLPEALRVVQMDHMRHLVRDHVVEHVFGRKNKAPGAIEVALRVARAPAGAGIAQAEAADAAVDARRLLARPATDPGRSGARRGGKACVRKLRSRLSPVN